MLDLTKAQEREERQGLGRGMVTSMFGLLFCWVPLLGLLLAGLGFGKIASRVTGRHKGRKAGYCFMSFLILVGVTAVLMAECYFYVQNPNIIQETGMKVYTFLTGESELPSQQDDGEYDPDIADGTGVDYDQTGAGGLGMDTSIYGYDGDEVWGYDAESDIANSDDYTPETGG